MYKHLGKIWVSGVVLVVAIVAFVQGDPLTTIRNRPGDAPFLVAITQLGILYVVALFVERALEVLMKAWRQGHKIRLEEQLSSRDENDRHDAAMALKEYQAGTQKRALLVGLTLGTLVSLSGVRLLAPMFEFEGAAGWTVQERLFHVTDVVITAGLIAGGSSTIHELMALIDDFLRASRKRVKQTGSTPASR